ncbi:MAG: YbaB/EbfC family nucleoid-associated protein [Actinomycetota bacterium]|nr:YbaB/EbfC family nucleoid-associated protein [Actinomycetota bacterium]
MSKGKYQPKAHKEPKADRREMMKQVEGLTERMSRVEASLAEEEIEYSVGGGAVTVVVDGRQNVKSIKIDKEAVDPQDVAMLEDMITAAVNGAMERARKIAEERLGEITGGLGLGIPGF